MTDPKKARCGKQCRYYREELAGVLTSVIDCTYGLPLQVFPEDPCNHDLTQDQVSINEQTSPSCTRHHDYQGSLGSRFTIDQILCEISS